MIFTRRRRVLWFVLAELSDRPGVDVELPSRIARHTLGAFRPSLRAVKRAVVDLLTLRFVEYVGETAFLRLSETGLVVVSSRARAMSGEGV